MGLGRGVTGPILNGIRLRGDFLALQNIEDLHY